LGRLFSSVTFLALALTLAALPARAQAVAKVDPRAMAMGGGFVSVADGWAALQWNPAGMWVSGRNEAAVVLGNAPFEAGPWVEALRVAAGVSEAIDPADAAATLASPGAGLAGEQALGVYFVSKHVGGAFQQVTYVDEVVGTEADGIDVDMAALRTREFQVSGAYPLAQGRLIIGGSAKLVQAQVRLRRLPFESLQPSDIAAGELLSRARSGPEVTDDTVLSFDAGVLFMVAAKFRIGGVVKNLNAPDLGEPGDPVTRLPRQIRVGGLLLPHPALKLTLDFDLSSDVFVVGGRERRELGGGVEWAAESVAVRAGLLFDVQAFERRPTYTFGLGLGGETVRADLGGSWAPDRDGFGWLGALAADF
jgi:hypothetical protein